MNNDATIDQREDENHDDESSDVMDGEEAPIEEDSVAVRNGLSLQEGE